MRSLRTRITLMTVYVVIIAVVAITMLSVFSIRNNEQRKSDQLLLLLCETGEMNLDYYFDSVQNSVGKVASFVEADLEGLTDEELAQHMERVSDYFGEMASKTNGVLTYYYRIDPEVSGKVKGFWYVDLDGSGFVRHSVTDITTYDTSDTTNLVWFTVPKHEGSSIWLPPYITDNLYKRVISYNVPIYYRGRFVGVVGIEIDYSTMAKQVDSIRLYSNGYAFLSDAKGNLFYHPRIDISKLNEKTMPEVPDVFRSENTFVRYTFDGQEKLAARLPLSNGMWLNVSAPIVETEGNWKMLILKISVLAICVLAAAVIFTMLYTKRITKPITQLTEAANQVDNGNYNIMLDYDKNDEIGRLTKTFKRLTAHMRDNISDLNRQVYIDSLTHVKNQGAFSVAIDQLQAEIKNTDGSVQFAIGIFDCDELKTINDENGHEKGDIYLQTASKVICDTFYHSPVFRIGGDEFAVILRSDSYLNMDSLIDQFEQAVDAINHSVKNSWEQVHISIGMARYDKENDQSVYAVVRRADKEMYENKRRRKKTLCASEAGGHAYE